jgi:tryptophan synthase alpha chain
MNAIQTTFQRGKVFIAYLTAGDGGIQHTLRAAQSLIAAGVDMLEIGVPFSDPIADGPVIQRAAARALRAGTTLDDILWLTREIRRISQIPLILFSYLNPILAGMQQHFLKQASVAGINGLLLVDCPLEESTPFRNACEANDLAYIQVITPATDNDRLSRIIAAGSGFLYYACRKGTTGIRAGLPADFTQRMAEMRNMLHLPVVVGFGVGDRETVATVLQHADGVVVGSRFVKALEEGMAPEQLGEFVKEINCTSHMK